MRLLPLFVRENALRICLFFFICIGCRQPIRPHIASGETTRNGKALFTNLGCIACHSTSGEKKYGPPLNLLYHKTVTVYEKGKKISLLADKAFLKKSIVEPDFQKAEGYEHRKMAIPSISGEEVECLVDYLVSIGH